LIASFPITWHHTRRDFLWDLFHKIYDVELLVRVGGLAGLTAIVFVETGLLVGFFLPGDSLLVTAGLFAARGDLEVVPMIVVLSIAAIIGDTVGYNIGARAGPKLFTRPDSLLFNRKHLITTKEFYERHGPFTIVIARFIPILRTFAPVVAGIGAMEYKRFIVYNVAGGIGWVITTVLGGYFLGQMVPNIHDHIHKVIAIVIVLSLLPAIIKVVKEKLKRSAS
jgi:membrane-associated protein